jgi:hypothetical protein
MIDKNEKITHILLINNDDRRNDGIERIRI